MVPEDTDTISFVRIGVPEGNGNDSEPDGGAPLTSPGDALNRVEMPDELC